MFLEVAAWAAAFRIGVIRMIFREARRFDFAFGGGTTPRGAGRGRRRPGLGLVVAGALGTGQTGRRLALLALSGAVSLGLLFVVPLAASAQSLKITVCASGCQYTTIQAAIDNARNHAMVSVAPGTYAGFNVPGNNMNSSLTITISGAGAGQTTIDDPNGVTIISSLPSVTLAGLTITGANNPGGDGGGIFNNGTLTLKSSTVTGNSAHYRGGGIANGGKLTLIKDIVSDNASSGGGGIFNGSGGAMTLKSSTVTDNKTSFRSPDIRENGNGGGILNFGTTRLQGSMVTDNSAGIPGDGGGIYNGSGGSVTVSKNSTIDSNSPDDCVGATC